MDNINQEKGEKSFDDFVESLKHQSKLYKSPFENYNYNLKNYNNVSAVSRQFYQEHFIMAMILEVFIQREELSFKKMNEHLWNRVPKEFHWNVTVNFYQEIISKMVRIGYLKERLDSDEKDSLYFMITELGIRMLQEQVFQNLASASFFSYQSYGINKNVLHLTYVSLVIAVVSLIVAVIALK